MTKDERIKRRLAVAVLLGIHAAVFFAGFIAPYDFSRQNRELVFAPPTRVHFVDAQGRWRARPFVYRCKESAQAHGGCSEDTRTAYPLRFFARGAEHKVAGLFVTRRHLFGVDEPARVFLLGSDAYGRDVFSRLLWGGRVALLAGWLAAGLALGLGIGLGALAGFYGRWIDSVLMRGGDLFLALPWLYLLLAVRAFLPLHLPPAGAFLSLVGVLGVLGWPRPARLIRGVVLSAKERSYIRAARGFGASDLYLLRRHVLPQTMGVALTQAAILIPQYVLAEVSLSFLGLGVSEPVPSWGNMLASLAQYHVLTSYWWMCAPALTLVIVSLSFHSVADVLERQARSVPF